MNLKVVLKDYIDFLESRGVHFPSKYNYRMNEEMYERMKLILDDVDYDFIMDIIDDYYKDLKNKIKATSTEKVCIKFANRIVVGTIEKINYTGDKEIESIDFRDKKNELVNIKFDLIYSVEKPRTAREVKKAKEVVESPTIELPIKAIKNKTKYEELIEPDLMSTRQIKIIDRPEYIGDDKPSLSEIIFSKGTLIAIICIGLAAGAIMTINHSIAVTTNKNKEEVVCIDGYTNINGECIKTNTVTNEEQKTTVATTTTTTKAVVNNSLVEVINSFKKED
jgi:hypothetical protein